MEKYKKTKEDKFYDVLFWLMIIGFIIGLGYVAMNSSVGFALLIVVLILIFLLFV